MTGLHVALLVSGYAVKAGVSYVLWRRFGPRVKSLGRLARRRRSSGKPVLARATPGHLSRTFRMGPPVPKVPRPAVPHLADGATV